MKREINLSSLTVVEQLFCLTISAGAAAQVTEVRRLHAVVGDEVLWAFAQREGSASIVAGGLEAALGPTGTAERWRTAAQATRRTLELYLAELDRVAAALHREGIALVALKNAGIARALHRDLAGCPMGDVDTLVSPRGFRRAHAIMKSLGFELGNRSPFEMADIEQAERHGGAEYTGLLADGSVLWFELQWRPVAGRWIRPDQEPPADELLARAVAIPGTTARLLAPEDNLLQVCLHTAKHSYVRAPGFRLHTDVDRIVRHCPIEWNEFCVRVEAIGVRTAVFLSLHIPSILLSTPVPPWVLARLDFSPRKHRFLLTWLLRVGLFGPKERKWGKLGYIVFNLLLYDRTAGILLAIFPDYEWMHRHYQVRNRWTLPWGYFQRTRDLLLKRANT
ncbi:MAG: nucleotidyltransferase family protein [Opitutaceae bacterium]|nr:nucleotidyltransferase family protein [Opitutaceae bacterium]